MNSGPRGSYVISTLTFLLRTTWKGKFGLCECP